MKYDPATDLRSSNVSQKQCSKEQLERFGSYMVDMLPKYVQRAELTDTGELVICIHPEGVVPVLSTLRDHSMGQFTQLVEMTAVDVPKRKYRFEVSSCLP